MSAPPEPGHPRVVVALGGNALSPSDGAGDVHEMRAALARTARALADLVDGGVSLVVTHGNGPQVGRILLQQEYAADQVPPMPMDVCGAQSQGQIGYLLAQTLDTELRRRGIATRVLCLVTQVVVDGRDPAFRRPTKPVGPSYEQAEAERIAHETGYVFRAMPDGRWRRAVASPRPKRLVEAEPLRQIIEAGHVVVAAGGGGVPVVEVGTELRGVEAVIDKDLTAATLARLVGADQLVILTEVSRVQVGFGTDAARELSRMTVTEARELLAAGEFPDGSMGPKVRACVEFVTGGGRRAVIGALSDAHDVVFAEAGTSIEAG
ncbi:MAG TPA: carbamate kinase [Mycobacteriales bacterium]|nr:carbamate kinase [Mycobacteriales bacterium]